MSSSSSHGLEVDPDGRVRCPHRDLFGNVCRECFDATPNLADVFGEVYDVPPFVLALDPGSASWLADATLSPRTVIL